MEHSFESRNANTRTLLDVFSLSLSLYVEFIRLAEN